MEMRRPSAFLFALLILKHAQCKQTQVRQQQQEDLQLMVLWLQECHGLQGRIPEALHSMAELLVLELQGNSLTGSFPESLGALRAAYWVYLSGNDFRGSMPDAFGSMTSLKTLRFQTNKLTGAMPDAVGQMRTLESWMGATNNLEGNLPEAFGSVLGLALMYLAKNKLTNSLPSALSHLEGMQLIVLGNNRFHGKLPEGLGFMRLLQTVLIDDNRFSGALPGSMSGLKEMVQFTATSNKLTGSFPDALSFMQDLYDLELVTNRFTHSLPDSIARMRVLQRLSIYSNAFGQSFPEALGWMGNLDVLIASENIFTGTLPDSLAELRMLKRLEVKRNLISGTVPEAWRSSRGLTFLKIGKNYLAGTLPEAITLLQRIMVLHAQVNEFRGAIPSAIAALKQLQVTTLSTNHLTGSLPDALGALRALRSFVFDSNRLCGAVPDRLFECPLTDVRLGNNALGGSLPDAITCLRGLETLLLLDNLLTGALPEGLRHLRRAQLLAAGCNAFSGTIPDAFGAMMGLSALSLHANKLTGALPGSIVFAATLDGKSGGFFDENALTSTVPGALCSWSGMANLGVSRNAFEGTMPDCLGRSPTLMSLVLSGDAAADADKPKLRGSIPAGIGRARELWLFCGANQQLEGHIPSLSSTLRVLVLRQNALQSLPALRLSLDQAAYVYVDHNRLSCRLDPGHQRHHLRQSERQAKLSLVAVGNHLTRPGPEEAVPFFLLPDERDGLFWFNNSAGLWVLLRVFMGSACLGMIFMLKIGGRHYLCIQKQLKAAGGQRGLLARLTRSFFAFMVSQALGGCLLLMMVARCDFYICPTTLTHATACLKQNTAVQIMVLVLWWRFCLAARQFGWCGFSMRHGRSERRQKLWRLLVKSVLVWIGWIAAVVVLSSLVVMNVAFKCTPEFLPIGGLFTQVLDSGIGVVQGTVSGLILPRLSRKLSKATAVPNTLFLSIAGMLSTCLIPVLVVLLLDGACLARWTRWWIPCLRAQKAVDLLPDIKVELDSAVFSGLKIGILRHKDVCTPRASRDVAACSRSIALKLHDVLLAKMIVAGLCIPGGRLLAGRHYTRAGSALTRLVLILELGMLVGASLPLLILLFCLVIHSEDMLIVVAAHRGFLREGTDMSEHGAARVAVIFIYGCSVLFYTCFVSQDASVSALLGLAVLGMLL